MQRVELWQAGHAAFSMSSEVGRNICAPQGVQPSGAVIFLSVFGQPVATHRRTRLVHRASSFLHSNRYGRVDRWDRLLEWHCGSLCRAPDGAYRRMRLIVLLVPLGRQLIPPFVSKCADHGAVPVGEGVLVAVPRGGGLIPGDAVVRADKRIDDLRPGLAAMVPRKTASNVPNRLSRVDIRSRQLLDEIVGWVRYGRNLNLHIGNQDKAGPIHLLRIADEVLPRLIGRGRAAGWSSSGGARFRLPSAVHRSQRITRAGLTGQGGGSFGFRPFIFGCCRVGANRLRKRIHRFVGVAAADAIRPVEWRGWDHLDYLAGFRFPLARAVGIDLYVIADVEFWGLERRLGSRECFHPRSEEHTSELQ